MNSYVEFSDLGDLIVGGQIRWFDDFDGSEWTFVDSRLPKDPTACIGYLGNVLSFVDNRSKTIAAAMSRSN